MRRGQVAAFTILGLVVVAIFSTVYVFREEIFGATFGRETSQALAVPPQAEKLRVFVDSCIGEVAEEALSTLSLQGGYINLPSADVPASPVYPFSNNFDLFGDSGNEVPFWFFEDAYGVQQTQVPSLRDMEKEIESYIDGFLSVCINDFVTFKQQGYSISFTPPKAAVTIGEKNVLFSVDFPIDFVVRDFDFSFDTFNKRVSSPLHELHAVAKEILVFENENYFIEDRVLEMMVVYDNIPFSGVDFECSPKSWTKTDVYNDLKNIMASNLPAIRIKGTTFTKGVSAKSFVIDALKKKHTLTSLFAYNPSWPLLMEVVGEDGEILRGDPFTSENEASQFLLPLFCLNDYHFVYNLKFPVVIALEKENTVFQFATLAIVQNNQPRENRANIGLFDVETPICDYPSKKLKVVAEGYRPNSVVSSLAGASISMKCLNQVCNIGTTQLEGSTFSLTKPVPSCFNGLMIAEKEGFHRAEKLVSTNQNLEEVVVTLEPLHEVVIDVLVDDEGSLREPYASEQVLFTFTNKEQKYATSVIYPSQKNVKLVAGSYEVSSSITIESSQGFKLKKKDIEVCNDVPKKGVLGLAGLTKKECTTHTIDATTINQIPVGGSSVDWFVNRESLLAATEVTLYALRGPTPQSIDEITKVYEVMREKEVRRPVLK